MLNLTRRLRQMRQDAQHLFHTSTFWGVYCSPLKHCQRWDPTGIGFRKYGVDHALAVTLFNSRSLLQRTCPASVNSGKNIHDEGQRRTVEEEDNTGGCGIERFPLR